MEEENKTRISVKTGTYHKVIQREDPPDFLNSEIHWLYENGLRIEAEAKISLDSSAESRLSSL